MRFEFRLGTIQGRSDKYGTMRPVPSTSRVSDDAAAIARSLHDPEAFAEVFDRHFAFVHRYIARRAGRDRADDLAAQTFTVAFSHRGRYRDDLGTARPWLLGISTNLMRAASRGDQQVASLVGRLGGEAVVSSFSSPPADASAASEDDDRLGNALARLQPDQREALLLHALGDLSYAEIAAALEIPIGTVRSRISRACAFLRAELEPPVHTGARRNHA
jgi:RNA polymerase sigma-70 factor, ECF subfamily